MTVFKTAIFVIVLASLTACGSAERKKNKAEAAYYDEKTETMQEYKSCVKKAGDDQAKLDACEMLIKAVK